MSGERRYPDLVVPMWDVTGDALEVIQGEDGVNKTTIVNRAVMVYAALRAAADGSGEVAVTVPEGDRRVIVKVRHR